MFRITPFGKPLDAVECKRGESQGRTPFTLQYVAGHDNIKTTMCHVHPREAAVQKLFARLAE